MIRSEREVERFRARSADGYDCVIVVVQEVVNGIDGMKRLETDDGLAVTKVEGDDEAFMIVNDPLHPNLVVHRSDLL